MTSFRADLHCHSTYSDGTLTPTELILHASACGLAALSITDHDCCVCDQNALNCAKVNGVELLSGIEFSAQCHNSSVHILAYSFCWQNPHIAAFSTQHRERRRERNDAILKNLENHGMPINTAELDSLAVNMAGRPHIAQIMVKKGYVKDLKRAFKLYLAEGSSCYEKGKNFTVEETIEVIHLAKGFAIIAHPHLINDGKVLQTLLALPFDGLEVYYSQFGADANRRWLEEAQKRKWLITGGSDFHGDVKPSVPLGCSWIDEEHYLPLRKRFIANNC